MSDAEDARSPDQLNKFEKLTGRPPTGESLAGQPTINPDMLTGGRVFTSRQPPFRLLNPQCNPEVQALILQLT